MWTTYLKNKVLNHIFGKETYTSPTTLYIGLTTSDPTAAGLYTGEPSGGGYARLAIDGTFFIIPTTGEITNDIPFTFPQATVEFGTDWGTITHWFISDSATSGNMLNYGELMAPKQITAGDTFSLTITEIIG